MKKQNLYRKQAFTWFTTIGDVNEIQGIIKGYYDDLVAKYKSANKTSDMTSPFHEWELKKGNVEIYISFGFDGLSIILVPRFDKEVDMDELYYDLGGSEYLATVEDVGGKPSYTEFVKVIEYLISPIKDKVGRIDYSEVEEYCRGGKGYVIFTEDEERYKPKKAEMKAIGLTTPDNLLEQMGHFAPR